MKSFKKLMVAAFIVLGMFIAPNIYAAEKGDTQCKECAMSQEKCEKMGEKRQKIWDQLNLTTEQKKQLGENKAKNREAMTTKFEQMKSCRESLKEELMKPELDMNKINGIQFQIKALQVEMVDNHLKSVLDVRTILTREQFEKFIEITGKHGKWQHKGDRGTQKRK